MTLSISTHWNACRHTSGEAMIEEVLSLGLKHIELGYDLTLDMVPGVRNMIHEKVVTIDSVHNFCPVPVGVPSGHPELFYLSSLDSRVRNNAVLHTIKTIEFAAEMGAEVVVVHAGRVDMKNMTYDLIDLCHQNRQYHSRYEKIKLKLIIKREKKIRRHLDSLYMALEKLLPVLQDTGIKMGLENLPSWEAIPSETEMEEILRHFNSPFITYWHDVGHGQIRQNLGFINHKRWLEKLSPNMSGMHIHDVDSISNDHLMPPNGNIDFTSFESFVKPGVLFVLEPMQETPIENIKEGIQIIRHALKMPVNTNGG